MLRVNNRIRKAVEREGAAYYVRLILLSFAATVAVTRLYLTLTGFPQIGNGTLHIAHLLWGGLALFISAILMVIYANRWVYSLGSILAGVGVGLFMDEVGKFITRANDYFYPPAAPIIYTLFLLVVLLYLEIRRRPKRDARSELYRVFDTLQEVLDRDLDAQEHTALNLRLRYIVSLDEDPAITQLASELLDFADSESVSIVPHEEDWLEALAGKWDAFQKRWLTRPRLRAVLIAGLGALGVWATAELFQLFLGMSNPLHIQTPLTHLTTLGRVTGSKSLTFFLSGAALKAACGLTLLAGAGLLAASKEKSALSLSYIGLLLFITLVNLIDFYFDQFSTIVPAAIEFGLLIFLLDYRKWYGPKSERDKA